jgi:hypothetical protein
MTPAMLKSGGNVIIGGLLLFLAGTVPAQTVVDQGEQLASDRPEAWAMAYLGGTTLFSGFGPAASTEFGAIHLGAGAAHIPHISTERRRVGFNGTKLEDLNKLPIFGRLRLAVGLPADFTLELGWTPPVEINGVKARRSLDVSLERPLLEKGRWQAGARAFYQNARISGDFTCSRETAANPPGSPGNPFGCREPSDDRSVIEQYGLELAVSQRLMNDRLEPYLAYAATRMNPRTHVRARVFEVLDRSLLTTELTTHTFTLGTILRPARRWEFLAALSWTPLHVRRPPDRGRQSDDLFSARLMLRRRFR